MMANCQHCCDHMWDDVTFDDDPENPSRITHLMCMKCHMFRLVPEIETSAGNQIIRAWIFDSNAEQHYWYEKP